MMIVAVQLSIAEILVLTSLLLAAPAMIVMLAAVFSGALSRTERSRYLPLRHREKDFWDTGTHGRDRGREGT
ncbi:MAG TPA: hypothetical protein VK576_06085 [Thermoleophilia bacterium]|nr:hypothetical protein [Thermoleophilia bacterium]